MKKKVEVPVITQHNLEDIRKAVVTLNRALSKAGLRFTLFTEYVGDPMKGHEVPEDMSDLPSNSEVFEYSAEELAVVEGMVPVDENDDLSEDQIDQAVLMTFSVYGSGASLPMKASPLITAMNMSELMFDFVSYVYKAARSEAASVNLLAHEVEGMEDDGDLSVND